jgi:hypothetical protein
VSIAMAHDVAETTLIPRPPKGREAHMLKARIVIEKFTWNA